jgi:hypothetical protein
LGVLEGHVLDSDDLSSWQALTVSGKTLHTNYIRDPDLVYYGGTEPAVTTLPATSIGHDSATLNGSLASLGLEPSVDVYFEFRKTGASTWSSTTAQAKTTRGTFSANISGLGTETEYEFRAVVAWDSETAYGDVEYFETKVAKKDISITSDSDISIQGKKTARGTARLTGKTEPQTEGRKLAKAEIRFTADSELSAEGGKIAQTEIALDSTTKFGTTSKKVAKAEIRLDGETKIETEGKAISKERLK